jgi:hypothetical protein
MPKDRLLRTCSSKKDFDVDQEIQEKSQQLKTAIIKTLFFKSLIRWTPLNVITDNNIDRLM